MLALTRGMGPSELEVLALGCKSSRNVLSVNIEAGPGQRVPRADEMVGSIFLKRASHRAVMRLWHLVSPRLCRQPFSPSWLQLGNSLGAGVGGLRPHWRVPGPAACRDGCPPRCHPPLAEACWYCCI